MADFPRTATDTVALVGDSVASPRALKRSLFEAPNLAFSQVLSEDFSGDLSAYTGVSNVSIVSGELATTVNGWGELYKTVGYVTGREATDIEFDFWVPANTDVQGYANYYGYQVEGTNGYIYIDNDHLNAGGPAGTWAVWPAYTSGARLTFVPDASTWYRVRGYIEGRQVGDRIWVKVWRRADPEPADWHLAALRTSTGSVPSSNYIYIDSTGASVTEPAKIDNVVIRGGGYSYADEALNLAVPWRSVRRLTIGAVSNYTERTFDIEAPPATALFRRRFSILGVMRSTSERVFDIEGALRSTWSRPFTIESASTSMQPETDIGAWVSQPAITVTTTAPSSAGSTTLTVDSTTGLQPGYVLALPSGEQVVVDSVDSSTTITLRAPLSSSVGSGATVNTARGFLPGIHVFSKAGVHLGTIQRYSMTRMPTWMLNNMGSCGFYVSRNSPEAHLIRGDRLIAFTFREGSPDLWVGNIEVDESSTSVIMVTAPDAFSLLTGAPVVIDETPTEPVAAVGVYQKIIDAVNVQKTRDGERTFTLVDAGATNEFYGSLDWDEDPLDALDDTAIRSDTEYHWRGSLSGGMLNLELVVANEVRYEGGIAITDGVGGNVASDPRWVRDTAPIRNGLRLTGIASSIAEYLPDWAQWVASSINPSVEVLVDPGDYRRRVDQTLQVGFGVSPRLLKSIAEQIVAELWNMYYAFLYAWHDQTGRPYHEGWGYEGPPSDIEPFLHTGLGWRTRLRLVQIKGEPASVVMYSDPEKQVVAVTYNRVTGEYKARRYWASEQEGVLYVPMMRIHGWAYVFDAEGGRLVNRRLAPFDHSSAIMSMQAVVMPYYWTDDDGKTQTTYYTVRRVTALSEDGAVTEGMWFKMATPAGPTTGPLFTRPTVGDDPYLTITLIPAPHNIEFDSGFITKMYEVERGRIRDWDPRRDGVGVYLNRRTVYNNTPSTRARWHLVPFGVGVDGTTSLTTGIDASTSVIYVDSTFSLPRLVDNTSPIKPDDAWDGMLQIGLDPAIEIVRVWSIVGNAITVDRGQQGTTAMIHEAGTSVKALNLDESSIFEHLWNNLDWEEGRAWAERLLQKMSKPFIRASVELTNRNGTWASARLGSVHPINLTTEGSEPLTGEVRVIGLSPDPSTGRMEVILEWQQ